MKLKNQKGAAAVEFAIVLPFLVLLVFGMIEFGILYYNQQVITNASREGARAGLVGDCNKRLDDTQISQIVTDYCIFLYPCPTDTEPDKKCECKRLITFNTTNNPPVTDVEPKSRGCGSGVGVGHDLTVNVTYDYDFLLPSLLGFGPKKTLAAQTVMRMESDE
jgi:Flp pilus assembly protein TadG